jgi:GNAT superfamily N-acetyltransferase
MFIRNITPNDEHPWRSLWAGYLAFYQVDLADTITKDVWRRLLDDTDPLQGLVAEHEGKVIGFTHFFFHGTTWYPTSYCYLEDLFVDPAVRSCGAGRALIQGVKDAALEKGAAKLYWHTNKQNETAQTLYNKVAKLTDFIRYDVVL